MAMENLIALQSQGLRSMGEPAGPLPNGVQHGSVLVVVDVNKTVSPAAVHWALGNVVRKGEHLKILGIITHLPNPSKLPNPVHNLVLPCSVSRVSEHLRSHIHTLLLRG